MSLFRGVSFGLITGIITALGVITGLFSSTFSSRIVILSVVLLAISDGLAESYGMYNSSDKNTTKKHTNSIYTSLLLFLTKFTVSMLLVIPFLFSYNNNKSPIIISIISAYLLIIVFTIYEHDNVYDKTVNTLKNLLMLSIICTITFLIGRIKLNKIEIIKINN